MKQIDSKQIISINLQLYLTSSFEKNRSMFQTLNDQLLHLSMFSIKQTWFTGCSVKGLS
jgi:hypothetical protein